MKRYFLALAISTFLLRTSVFGGIVIDFDLNEFTSGKQDSRVAGINEEFDVRVIMSLDNVADSISGYSFRVRYDTSELTLVRRSQQPTNGFILAIDDGASRAGAADPLLNNSSFNETFIGAANFGNTPFKGIADFEVARLTFRALNPKDDIVDLRVTLIENIDLLLNENFVAIDRAQIQLGSARINAIPEPNTLAIVTISGLLAMLFRRTRLPLSRC